MKNQEHKLQSKIVIDFSQKRPDERGRFFATFSETESTTDGAVKLSMGLIKSLPDTFYIRPSGVACGIEIKSPDSRHKTEHLRSQANYLINILKEGWFCDSIEMFWKIITTGTGGIDPRIVLNNLKSITTQSVSWDKINH